jgi:hypothetical protein
MTRALDAIHTSLSYVRGSLKNTTVVVGGQEHRGFTFSLLNPPVPLGGNVVSLDVFVDELPVQRSTVFVATQENIVNASALSEPATFVQAVPERKVPCHKRFVAGQGQAHHNACQQDGRL